MSYKPEFCEKLIDYGKQGMAFECFGQHIGVPQALVQEWLDIPEFHAAYVESDSRAFDYYLRAGRSAMLGKIKNFNTSAWAFIMKSRFGWDPNRKEEREPEQYIEEEPRKISRPLTTRKRASKTP